MSASAAAAVNKRFIFKIPPSGRILSESLTCLLIVERDTGVGRELLVVPELNHVPAALASSARTAQRFGMSRQQILAVADRDEIVVDRRFHLVERKPSWHAL